MSAAIDRRRLVAAVVLVAVIVSLAVLAWTANRSVRTVTEVRPAARRVAAVQPAPPADHPPRAAARVVAPATVPIATPRQSAGAPQPDPTPLPPPATAVPDPVTRSYDDCPALGLPAPAHAAGVAEIVPLVPLFGPFSAEAFAFLPALQPLIELLGPAMPLFGDALGDLAPLLEAVQPGAEALGAQGFVALAPLYGPVRPAFLDAEADLALALSPVVEAISAAPGTECAIALQAVLTEVLTAAR